MNMWLDFILIPEAHIGMKQRYCKLESVPGPGERVPRSEFYLKPVLTSTDS